MLFACNRARSAGWDSVHSRTEDFADVVAFFDLEIDTGAELWCDAFDGKEWFPIAHWSGVPARDWLGNPLPPRDGVLWFDPSNENAVRLSRGLEVKAEPRIYEAPEWL